MSEGDRIFVLMWALLVLLGAPVFHQVILRDVLNAATPLWLWWASFTLTAVVWHGTLVACVSWMADERIRGFQRLLLDRGESE